MGIANQKPEPPCLQQVRIVDGHWCGWVGSARGTGGHRPAYFACSGWGVGADTDFASVTDDDFDTRAASVCVAARVGPRTARGLHGQPVPVVGGVVAVL